MTGEAPAVETPAGVTQALSSIGPILEGKVIAVVGASRGIGAGIALGVARTGATLALASRDMDATNAVADQIAAFAPRPMVLEVDIAERTSIERCLDAIVDRQGRLDGAVNNAARSHPGKPFADLDDETYDAVMDVNVRGTMMCMRAEIRHLEKAGGGAIVNIASAGSRHPMKGLTYYITSKHAVAGLTRNVAYDYADRNIRINAISPGVTFTEMVARGSGRTPEGRTMLLGKTPMARMATPDEMAGPAIWLLSDLASFVTGALIPVDGGWDAS